jgi:hypothetical protein
LKLQALLLSIGLVPGPAAAFLGTGVKVGVRDAETNKPLEGAFVVVREFAEVGRLHGSSNYCVRAQAAAADAPWVTLKLPHAGSDTLVPARALEAFAYRPGYCLARIGNAAAAASHKRISLGMAPPPELDSSRDNALVMRRAAQAVDERLVYLDQVAAGLICHEARWGDGGKEALGRMADAMTAEASSIARSKYEKHLAGKLASRLAVAREVPKMHESLGLVGAVQPALARETTFARDFFVGPANARVSWGDGSRTIVGISNAPRAAVPARPGSTPTLQQPPPPSPPALVIHCRHGPPSACDLDERGADGATALHSLASAGRVEEVRVLLEAGADPNATQGPHGDTAMDIVLRQLLRNYESAARAAQILDLLAANPRTTIRAALREDLAADPSTWRMAPPGPARERVLQRREALLRLPVSPPARPPGCEDPNFEFSYRDPPPRLRDQFTR